MTFRTLCEYTESIIQYASNQHKSIQEFTYIHTEGPSASYIAVSAISAEPQRAGRDSPLSSDYSDYFPKSYYDKHTNTTEICPDYYMDLHERSNCLIFSIIIKIRYVSRCVVQIYNSIIFNNACDFIPT